MTGTAQDRARTRPLVSGRVAALIFASCAFVVVVLTFADRAPDYTIEHAPEVRAWGAGVEQGLGIDVVDRDDVPLSVDDLAHATMWVAVAGVVVLVADGRRWPGVLGGSLVRHRATLLLLLGLAVAFELGQGVLTSSRNLSLSDGLANVAGVSVGWAVSVTAVWLWRSIVGRVATSAA